MTTLRRIISTTLLLSITSAACDEGIEEPNADLDVAASDESGEPPQADHPRGPDGLAAPLGPLGADATDDLDTCEWKRASTSMDNFLYVYCDAAQKPISGGCNNDDNAATIQGSMPFENDALDFPEDPEVWYTTDGTTGWRCKKDGAAGTLTGVALCCGN
jgi:hypothetical protein